ncbi:glycoside hydrolase family 88/105 protein [Echinicola vietnamensis]|uniref:Putative unsaturated glucuronyl hydrolase n=1 Tax=Echinicola vietnamensis (strain DSM 17526 / LMG 23754 / KMM 6221) TaxID=926556 RepID=L0FXX8_ECHVK|nr:glycoside hydrolase family 88 protein [Echinicola vietnamensis]AGA77908.1 putative unsaturated glucuronyl hydrolase [Echinicola vietnamensis DSM 17526]
MQIRRITAMLALLIFAASVSKAQELPTKEAVMDQMVLTNQYFMEKWPDPGQNVITNKERTSNLWTRAVYYEGLMALYGLKPDKAYYDYAVKWGASHGWDLRNGTQTRHADNHCAGQTYIMLYEIDQQPERIEHIQSSIDGMMDTYKINDWDWIDALQMAMPVFAQLTSLTGDAKYSERMYEMYMDTKVTQGLFNPHDDLWWRDSDFRPPYAEPNGNDCYWSRGNGWVVAAMVRTLEFLPADDPHRFEYVQMLQRMLKAVLPVQRTDGFWNVSLHDPTHFEGKETSGTALFLYGMAWGVNNGLLEKEVYMPAIKKAWNAIASESIHDNGFLGYLQGTGKEPKDGQPVTYTSKPDFEDYGLGCFLLAATEMYKLVD